MDNATDITTNPLLDPAIALASQRAAQTDPATLVREFDAEIERAKYAQAANTTDAPHTSVPEMSGGKPDYQWLGERVDDRNFVLTGAAEVPKDDEVHCYIERGHDLNNTFHGCTIKRGTTGDTTVTYHDRSHWRYFEKEGVEDSSFSTQYKGYQYGSAVKGAIEDQLQALGFEGKLGEEKPVQPDDPLISAPLSVRNYAGMTRDQLLKSKDSFEKLISEHEKKLADYRADPYAFDNKGILKNAPEHLRQNIINGRIKALENQISKQREELRKILDLLRE